LKLAKDQRLRISRGSSRRGGLIFLLPEQTEHQLSTSLSRLLGISLMTSPFKSSFPNVDIDGESCVCDQVR